MSHPMYTVTALPTSGWSEYRKVGTTKMVPISGPCTVVTQEGPYQLPLGWTGYLALDAKGYPYPVESSIHDKSYELVD